FEKKLRKARFRVDAHPFTDDILAGVDSGIEHFLKQPRAHFIGNGGGRNDDLARRNVSHVFIFTLAELTARVVVIYSVHRGFLLGKWAIKKAARVSSWRPVEGGDFNSLRWTFEPDHQQVSVARF